MEDGYQTIKVRGIEKYGIDHLFVGCVGYVIEGLQWSCAAQGRTFVGAHTNKGRVARPAVPAVVMGKGGAMGGGGGGVAAQDKVCPTLGPVWGGVW